MAGFPIVHLYGELKNMLLIHSAGPGEGLLSPVQPYDRLTSSLRKQPAAERERNLAVLCL